MDAIPSLPPPLEPRLDYKSNSTSDDSIEVRSDDEVEDEMAMLLLIALHTSVMLLLSFQPIELSRENRISINPNFPMNNLLDRLATNPT